MEDPNLPVIVSSEEEEDRSFTHRAPAREKNPVIDKHGKKRPSAGGVGHKGTEVQDMLEDFGANINTALRAKKNRIEEFTKASFKNSNKKFEQVCEAQQQQIQNFYDDYSQKFKVVFQQCDLDMQKSKEQLGKIADSMQKQEEDFMKSRTESIQHLNTIRQVHLKFMQSLQNLEESNNIQLTDAESELKQEITTFKDKIMTDTICYTAKLSR